MKCIHRVHCLPLYSTVQVYNERPREEKLFMHSRKYEIQSSKQWSAQNTVPGMSISVIVLRETLSSNYATFHSFQRLRSTWRNDLRCQSLNGLKARQSMREPLITTRCTNLMNRRRPRSTPWSVERQRIKNYKPAVFLPTRKMGLWMIGNRVAKVSRSRQ